MTSIELVEALEIIPSTRPGEKSLLAFPTSVSEFSNRQENSEDTIQLFVKPFWLAPGDYVYVLQRKLFTDADRLGVPIPSNFTLIEHGRLVEDPSPDDWFYLTTTPTAMADFTNQLNTGVEDFVSAGFKISNKEGQTRIAQIWRSAFLKTELLAPLLRSCLRAINTPSVNKRLGLTEDVLAKLQKLGWKTAEENAANFSS